MLASPPPAEPGEVVAAAGGPGVPAGRVPRGGPGGKSGILQGGHEDDGTSTERAVPGAAQPPASRAPDQSPERALVSGGFRLEWHLARPPSSAARDATRTGLVIAHDLPNGPGTAATAAHTFPQLADRVSEDSGWASLSFCFRGAGRSQGRFTPAGWVEDLTAAVAFLRSEVSTVWIAGFGLGGTLALCVAALDAAVGGVATLGAPSDLSTWISDPGRLAVSVHESGLAPFPAPDDLDDWAAQIRAIDPLGSARAVPPRPLLIVHGSADEDVPLVDARALSDAAEGEGDLRVVPMAGHRLRHDPRAIAVLLGWLERGEG